MAITNFPINTEEIGDQPLSEFPAVESALAGKANASHSHTITQVADLQDSLDAKQDTLVSGVNLRPINGQSLLGSSNLVIDGGGVSPSSATQNEEVFALRLTGEPESANVKLGQLWDASANLPSVQFIEMLAKFNSDGQYIFSDNPGGRHAGCLLGVDSSGVITGNTTGIIGGVAQGQIDYGSGIPIRLNDLGVLARVHTTSAVIVYWKGIPIGIKEFSGTLTRNFNDSSASGKGGIGAKDHNGKDGWVVWCRMLEGSKAAPFTLGLSYAPSRFWAQNSQGKNGDVHSAFNHIWDLSNPFNGGSIPDHGIGREIISGQGIVKAHGYLSNSLHGQNFWSTDGEATISANNWTGHRPGYEKIPFGQTSFTETPPTPPSGALFYDSFTRNDVTRQWSKAVGIGTPEVGGSWYGATSSVAIINKHAHLVDSYAVVKGRSSVADFEVTYTRANSPYLRSTGHYEIYCPKMIDDDNFVQLQFDPYGQFSMLDAVNRYGTGTTIVGSTSTGSVGNAWTTLRCRSVGTTMQIYLDNVLVHTQTVPSRFTTSLDAGWFDTGDNYRKIKSFLIKAS